MLDSKALTRIQSIILIAIIVVAAVGGGVAYVLLSGTEQTSETIKIGVLADLDAGMGKEVWQGVLLAAEQLNAEEGLLGKQVEVVGEDTDSEGGSSDAALITSALLRLIDFHKVDFVIASLATQDGLACQEIIAQHKKILISVNDGEDLSQRVLDDYNQYKYYFSMGWNESSVMLGMTDGLLLGREITGFNKIGFLGEMWAEGVVEGLEVVLSEAYGFDVVYSSYFPYGTVDFSSYFAAAEAAGVEMLVPVIAFDGGIPFVKEYYDRQSPLFIYGGIISTATYPESWEWTDGKCEHVGVSNTPIVAGYPLTSKTIPTRDAYFDKWGESIDTTSSTAFDVLRYILSDAIERAGTIETEAVIEALEETNVETSNARNFVFTESHGLMMGVNPNDPEAAYAFVMYFQWQDGELVPVYPRMIMEEVGASYTFPDWPGPWDNLD
ncbi:MAG: ABC transporter substrate-binding protein [Candidatus Bathyarchaeota archaeon]